MATQEINGNNVGDLDAVLAQLKGQGEAQGEQKIIENQNKDEQVNTPDGGNDGGSNGDGNGKTGKPREKREIKAVSTLFKEKNVGKDAQYTKDSVVGKLMSVNSKLSSIAGFIVPNSPRVEIVVNKRTSKKKDQPDVTTTEVGVKEKFSQQIKGVIINYCPELVSRIREEKSVRGETAMTGEMKITVNGEQVMVARKDAEAFLQERSNLDYTTEVFSYEEAIKWITDNCWYEIAEAPGIFWSHKKIVKKTVDKVSTETVKEIKSAADLTASQSTSYQVILKFDEVLKRYQDRVEKVNNENLNLAEGEKKKKQPKTPTLKDIYPLASRYRGRKLAIPGNFIAIKKYIQINTKSSYSAEEQAENNLKYIREGFNPSKKDKFMEKLQYMTSKAKENVTITDDGDVTASRFFMEGNSLVADTDYLATIPRWWGKEERFTPLTMKLVKKELVHKDAKTDKNGKVTPASDKYVLSYTEFGKDGNRLANEEYKKIVDATDNRLTEEQVIEFIGALSTKSTRNPNVRGSVDYDTAASSQTWISQIESLTASINARA